MPNAIVTSQLQERIRLAEEAGTIKVGRAAWIPSFGWLVGRISIGQWGWKKSNDWFMNIPEVMRTKYIPSAVASCQRKYPQYVPQLHIILSNYTCQVLLNSGDFQSFESISNSFETQTLSWHLTPYALRLDFHQEKWSWGKRQVPTIGLNAQASAWTVHVFSKGRVKARKKTIDVFVSSYVYTFLQPYTSFKALDSVMVMLGISSQRWESRPRRGERRVCRQHSASLK